jgi:hypothetical protein
MSYFWSGTLAIGVLFQILVIASLTRGLFRRFTVLSVYAIVSFFLTVVEAAVFLKLYTWKATDLVHLYWVDEIVVQVLVFALVISLTSSALKSSTGNKRAGFSLYGAALIVMALSILLAYTTKADLSAWMTEASRNLSFASAILNLLLWSVLLSQRNKDQQLLMLSGGFGVQTTGKAMGHSIRRLGHWDAGNVFMVLTYILSLAIIWYALRKKAPEKVDAETSDLLK